MLNSNRDKSIKRYLAKIGELKVIGKIYPTRYYFIPSLKISVRFADHFKVKSGANLEIVKTSQSFYTIKTDFGLTLTCLEAHILIYLKSIFLLYPEMNNCLSIYRDAAVIAKKKYDVMSCNVAEIEDLREKSADYKKQLNITKNQVSSLQSQNESLQKQVNILKSKVTKTRNKLREITNGL